MFSDTSRGVVLLLTASVSFCIYHLARRIRAYQVFPSFLNLYIKLKIRKIDRAFGIRHGCQPPNRLLNELPLGVDRLYQISQAHSDNRLMALFLYHFRRWGDTLEQVFLGTRAFGTIDPRNLEAILSTQFNG